MMDTYLIKNSILWINSNLMINISDETASVDGTLGSTKQKVGTNCTEEEYENKNWYVSIILDFFDPYRIIFLTQRCW